ncbi:MAG: ABC transporter substrate-binding protein [Rothia sp. (in: high G+C Gram-positive bacteria)]|nr:ABC transporter substrate-binding protein [Rothia sp. (in: high G+C Gram-positive bacteria)]
MTLSRATFLKLTAAGALTGLLSACSTGSSNSQQSGSSASGGSYTVEHAFGSSTFSSVPQKVAVVQPWKNPDVLLALGLVPAGTPYVSWGENANRSTDWFDAKLAELGGEEPTRYDETDGPNYEALATLEPDAIFSPYGDMTQEVYDKLSGIAPVIPAPVGVGAYETSWQQCLEMAGKMLQREDDATAVITEVEGKLAEAVAAYPNLKGASFIAGYFDTAANTFGAYTSEDSRPQFFSSIGMVNAPYIAEHEGEATGVFLNISPEVLDEVECDVLWAWANSSEDIEAIRGNELFANMPALKNNAALFDTDKHKGLALSAASPLSLPWVLESSDLLSELSTAVENTKATTA